MNYKIVRKKETPNIWEFWKDGKLYITIDETKETSTGNGLLTMYINFNKHPIEIDVAGEIRRGKETDSKKRKRTEDEKIYLRKQATEEKMQPPDFAKMIFSLMDYIYYKWMLKQ